jgi:hypothetical protein
MPHVRTAGIPPSKFALCNFVRFSHPNHIENLLESKLPDAIDHILRNHAVEYVSCFYQWYGYLKPMYHFAYSYSKYQFMMSLGEILKTVAKLKWSDPLTPYDIMDVFRQSSYITKPFWNNTVCFTYYGSPFTHSNTNAIPGETHEIFATLMTNISLELLI